MVLALRIAAALGRSVEELFELETPTLGVELADEDVGAVVSTRVVLGTIRGRTVARTLSSLQGRFWGTHAAHGLIVSRNEPGQAEIARLRKAGASIFLVGCDPGLGLLAEHATRTTNAGVEAFWWHAGNARAQQELAQRRAHAAAVHRTRDSLEPEFPFEVVRIRLASWELGWIVASGNPKAIATAEDLARSDVTFVNREEGAGARTLLDELLARAGVPATRVRGYERRVAGHAEVAEAVRVGIADVGLAIALGAHVAGLGFVPLQSHVCDLYVPVDEFDQAPVQAVLNTLASSRFRLDLGAFGPYETSETGDRVEVADRSGRDGFGAGRWRGGNP